MIRIVLFADEALVLMLEGVSITNPEGSTVTVLVALLYPGAETVSVVVPTARPCTQIVPTLVLLTFVKVTVELPTTAEPFEITATAGPLLVTVTVTGLGGADCNEIDSCACRSLPMFTLPIEILGALTVTGIC